jgi:hypothetical protein
VTSHARSTNNSNHGLLHWTPSLAPLVKLAQTLPFFDDSSSGSTHRCSGSFFVSRYNKRFGQASRTKLVASSNLDLGSQLILVYNKGLEIIVPGFRPRSYGSPLLRHLRSCRIAGTFCQNAIDVTNHWWQSSHHYRMTHWTWLILLFDVSNLDLVGYPTSCLIDRHR